MSEAEIRDEELLNPYSVGGSLGDPRGVGFFGREDVFDFVLQSLQSVQRAPVLLYGQRRIGKSSVLRQLPRHLPAGTVSVFFDLQGQAALPLEVVLYGLAREIAPRCGLPRPARDSIDAESFLGFLDQACAALGSPRRLVLLFDEFDVIDVGMATNAAASAFLGYLARMIEAMPQLGVVMVIGRKVSELSEAFVGTILRGAVQHRLARLTRPQSDALAVELGAGKLAFDEPSLAALYSLAAGHPYCTQLLCNVLWQRRVRHASSLPVSVGGPDVQAALAPAIEYGTSGLNWIYDGLDVPAHRLFLAALAELQGEHPGATPGMAEIEKRLFRKGAPIDAVQLRMAPEKLANWDVVDGTAEGYTFAVPLVGAWIHANRPLVALEAQARLANPRAWRLYELAVASQESGATDEAIGLFEETVAANPALIEGFLSLGALFRQRDEEGDLDRAIEAFERAQDLDPAGPRTALLAALAEKIERSGHDDSALVKAFTRIRELDPEGAAVSQARRQLIRLAGARLQMPRRLDEAERIFRVLGDQLNADAAKAALVAQAPRRRADGIAVMVMLLGFVLAGLLSIDGVANAHWVPEQALLWLRRALVAASVGAVPLVDRVYVPGRDARLALVALGMAGLTLIAAGFGINLVICSFAGFFIGAFVSDQLLPQPKEPPELSAPATKNSRRKEQRPLADMALNLAAVLQRYARRTEKADEEKKP